MADTAATSAAEAPTVNGTGEVKTETADGGAGGDVKTEPAVEVEDDSEYADNAVYMQFKKHNLVKAVIVALLRLFDKEIMKPDDLDERVIEMLQTLRADQAQFVIEQVEAANLIGVQNRASFLMAVIRNFRDRLRTMGPQAATAAPLITGPDKTKLQALLDRTGYSLEVTIGQRKYGGPPPDFGQGKPPNGAEVYVGNIPNEMFEDDVIPLFEECGKIYDFRLMMDPVSGNNRGYGFVTFCDRDSATAAAKKYNGHEIKSGKVLKVNVSVANTRLFLGNIPKSKSKEEILEELRSLTEGLTDVIIHATPEMSASHRNRGFIFVDFEDHKAASDAKRKLSQGKVRPWNCDLVVDWAQPIEEPDEDTMAKVKVLYVKKLKESVTEEEVQEKFKDYGEIDHVKKIRDYAFVHYKERENAIKAMEALQGVEFDGTPCDISLAKPQVDKMKREKQRLERERRQMGMMSAAMGGRGGFRGRGGPRGGGGFMGGQRGGGYMGGGMNMRGARGARGGGRGGYSDYSAAAYGDYGYGGGYDAYSGYGGGWGGYSDYDGYGSYGGGYGGGGYGAGGGYGGGYGGSGYGRTPRGTSFGASLGFGSGGRSRGYVSGFGRGSSRGGGGGFRGGKRPADTGDAGPAQKKPTPLGKEDFSADINMTSF